jgi:hypothetical protein
MKAVRQLATAIELLIGAFGLYLGFMLISDPTGRRLDLSTSWLQHTLFSDYMLPGWVFALGIGLVSMVAALFTVYKKHGYRTMMLLAAGLTLFLNLAGFFLLAEQFGVQWVLIFLSIVLVLLAYVLSRPVPETTIVTKATATSIKSGKTHHFHKHRKRGH